MSVLSGGKDALTQKRLLKGWQCHHLDMSPENYDNFEEDRFVCLNKLSHSTIHFLYNYYKSDRGIIARLINILDRMIELNT